MNALPWKFRLEHIDILVLFAGLIYYTIRRFTSSTNFLYQYQIKYPRTSGKSLLKSHLRARSAF